MQEPLDHSWRSRLLCPYCGSALSQVFTGDHSTEGEFGVLRCECREYPLVSGIPILISGRLAGPGVTGKTTIELIRARRYEEALLALLRPQFHRQGIGSPIRRILPSPVSNRLRRRANALAAAKWEKRVKSLLFAARESSTVRDLLGSYFGPIGQNTPDPLDYFFYRFGQPRQLTALSIATIAEPSAGPVLDLGCGPGHLTRFLCHRYDEGDVVGLDNHFFLLYVAKTMIAPEAIYICCDADIGLPFQKDSFATINCVNTFHFIHQKVNCVNEMQRVTRTDGLFLLLALRHSHIQAATPNTALPPSGYARLWHGWQHITVSDRSILRCYLEKSTPDLTDETTEIDIETEPVISMIISQDARYFGESRQFADWPHASGHLALNPLYSKTKESPDGVEFERRYPSRFYAEENSESRDYLLPRVTISYDALSDLNSGTRSPALEDLVKHCVVLDMPPSYC